MGPRPYQAYVVVKPIEVLASRAAAHFGQPGGGIQYRIARRLKSLRKGGSAYFDSFEHLKDNGFLRMATPKDRQFLRGGFQAQASQ